MRWRVTLQARSANTTTGVVSWSNTSTVWAEVSTQAGGPEFKQQGGVAGLVNYFVRVRQPLAVTPKDRLVWNGKTLNIDTVRMLNLAYLELNCSEKQ
jgi:head-tail adaptor